MKFYYRLLLTVSIVSIFTACEKDEEFIQTTNLWIVNGEAGMPAMKVEPGVKVIYANEPAINFGAAKLYGFLRGTVSVKAVNATDSTTIYSNSFDLQKPVYSLFITGQVPTAEAFLYEEMAYPFIPTDKIYTTTDSVVNVRYVNLSPNSVPLKIKIASAATNEEDALAYKSVGTWKQYKSTATTTTYSIQIRNAATDALITTYSFVANATNRFKNVTLMIRGLQGIMTGANAFGVSAVNYF
jgi:hypothetical protein